MDVGEQLAEALAAHHLVAGRQAVVGEVDVHRVDADRRGAAQVVERAVARDPIEPGPHVDLALVGEHRVVGRREDLLQDVLGVLARAEHVPAEGQQARLVARAQHLEGGMLPAARQRDQALVGLQAEQRGGPAQARHAAWCVSAETSIDSAPPSPVLSGDTVATASCVPKRSQVAYDAAGGMAPLNWVRRARVAERYTQST